MAQQSNHIHRLFASALPQMQISVVVSLRYAQKPLKSSDTIRFNKQGARSLNLCILHRQSAGVQSVRRAQPKAVQVRSSSNTCAAGGGKLCFNAKGLRRALVKSSCAVLPSNFQSRPVMCRLTPIASPEVLANQSLNRTHCGVPPFGLEKPSPNAVTPQRSG